MSLTANRRMGLIAAVVLGLDQLTKWLVLQSLPLNAERVVIDGFFKLVHWGNTGAAWSLFTGYNGLLAIISIVAVIALFLLRHHFGIHRPLGQVALGLLFGGILGNLVDRLHPDRLHVIDFLYFHARMRSGEVVGFPAFNVADSAICTGVALLFLLSWQSEQSPAPASPESAETATHQQ